MNDTSKFFYDVDLNKELMEDFSDSELELLSDDEIMDTSVYMNEEDDIEICEQQKQNLHNQI